MKEKLLEIINSDIYTSMREKDFCYLLGAVSDEEKNEVAGALTALENEGVVIKNAKNKYVKLSESSPTQTGTFRKGNGNYGFVTPDSPSAFGDVFISPKNTMQANDGDRVVVSVITKATGDKKAEGKIIRITEHCENYELGIVLRGKRGLFADTMRGTYDLTNTLGAKRNDIVLIKEIGRISKDSSARYAQVKNVVGNMADEDINIKMAIARYAIPTVFDGEVAKEAKNLVNYINTEDIASRKDLRGENIFTIDSFTAKDLDDAVGICFDGNIYNLKVSIADVSYFVREGSAIDKAAYERGTSVYFPGTAVHMLPKELSENLCSLAPDVDRLAFTVEMDIDRKGRVVRSDFYKSLIRSKGKLTYEEVNRLFDGEKNLPAIYDTLKSDLYTMKGLYEILSDRRSKRGSIDLDMPESEVYIENGRIEDIYLRERGIAERLIEEFMLITNTTVAEFIARTGVASLYRSHEDPDRERLENFRTQMNLMGHSIRLKDEYYSGILNKFLTNITGEDDEFIIRKMLLRCMKKACYSVNEKSHFALGYEYYTHFTSPIRRYPDLTVHRVLSKIISGTMTEEDMDYLSSTLPQVAEDTSKRERVAEDAERYCNKLYMAHFMDEYRDEVFTGIISGVIKSGMFVQLGNLIEGFVPLHSMEDDYYDADVLSLKVVGRRHGDVYSLGDAVEVGVDTINFITGDIDFYLV